MKTLILAAVRCSLMFTAVAALSIVYPTSVQAVPTTYQYTRNPFTVVTAPYTTRSQDAVFAPTMRLGKVVDPANDNCPRLQPWTIFGSKPGTLVPYF